MVVNTICVPDIESAETHSTLSILTALIIWMISTISSDHHGAGTNDVNQAQAGAKAEAVA